MDASLKEASENGDVNKLHSLLQKDCLLLDRLAATAHNLHNNPLHIAARLGHSDFAREVLLHKPELATETNGDGFTALHLSAHNDTLEVMKALLEKDTSLCLMRDKDGQMPIHTAALHGKLNVLCELYKACSESRQKVTCHGDTIIHLAIRSNNFEVVKFLIEHMASDAEFLNMKNSKGNTILHLAVARKRLEIVEFLLRTPGLDVNALNLKGFTPLDVVLESPSQDVDAALASMLLKSDGKRGEEMQPPELRRHGKDTTSRRGYVAMFIAAMIIQESLGHSRGSVQGTGRDLSSLWPLLLLKFNLVLSSFFIVMLLSNSLSYGLEGIVKMPSEWVTWISVFSTASIFSTAKPLIYSEKHHLMLFSFLGIRLLMHLFQWLKEIWGNNQQSDDSITMEKVKENGLAATAEYLCLLITVLIVWFIVVLLTSSPPIHNSTTLQTFPGLQGPLASQPISSSRLIPTLLPTENQAMNYHIHQKCLEMKRLSSFSVISDEEYISTCFSLSVAKTMAEDKGFWEMLSLAHDMTSSQQELVLLLAKVFYAVLNKNSTSTSQMSQ